MMNLIIEEGAAWAGTAVDLPAVDPEWAEDGTFYDPVECSGDTYYRDAYDRPRE